MALPQDKSSLSDEKLVKAAQRGDMDAFEELVARHRDKIYARAFSMMRGEDEALDVSQEAWVKGWQRLKQFQGESSFVTGMTRIVINLCLDQLRKHKRQKAESIEQMNEESGGVERQMPVVSTNPTEGLERRELRARYEPREWALTIASLVATAAVFGGVEVGGRRDATRSDDRGLDDRR